MKEIKREIYLERIRPFYDSSYIKLVTGIRRSGKSVILRQIAAELLERGVPGENIHFYDLEGKSGSGIVDKDSLERKLDADLVSPGRHYVFLDEVQRMEGFEEALGYARASYGCSIFATGSNSRLLHGRMQHLLTGRAKEFRVLPFTYRECMEFRSLNGIETPERPVLEFLQLGGMPQRFEERDEEGVLDYLRAVFSSIVEKDVFGEHPRISRPAFMNIAEYVVGNAGAPFSAASLSSYLLGGRDRVALERGARAILNYLDYLEESYLLISCRPYYISGKKALKGTRKRYAPDVGLRASMRSEDKEDGFGLENLVFLELLSRNCDVRWGAMRDGEIDFVVSKGARKAFVQVAAHLYSKEALEREYGALLKVRDASPKYVISLDEEDSSRDGVVHVYLPDLLEGKVDLLLT